MGSKRPLKLEEVKGFEYVAVDPRVLAVLRANWDDAWGTQTPIALCVRCGRRYTEDPNRDPYGEPMHQYPEDDREPRCDDCAQEAFAEAFEKDLFDFFEDKLGLAEKHRDALKLFIETIFTDPQKILQMQDLNNRVSDLEKQTGRLWVALGIAAGLVAISIAAVVAIALALAS